MKSQDEMKSTVDGRAAWTAGYQAAHNGEPLDLTRGKEWSKGYRQYRFDRATEHAYECDCPICKTWWTVMGEES